jgi:hypothetical protein
MNGIGSGNCRTSLPGAIATKQSRIRHAVLDCFASLAMTEDGVRGGTRLSTVCRE